jgi:GNAT superfamily N-acetyltransferase
MSASSPDIAVRPAQAADVPLVHALICELAEYEDRLAEVLLDTATLEAALFGPERRVEAIVAEVGPQPAGFALFLHTFSTFRGRPNLYIEDLFVRPALRRGGVGQALLTHLAQLALERRCGRLEWSVLTWNKPALEFYRQLGAEPVTDWAVYDLSGVALERLAAGARLGVQNSGLGTGKQ